MQRTRIYKDPNCWYLLCAAVWLCALSPAEFICLGVQQNISNNHQLYAKDPIYPNLGAMEWTSGADKQFVGLEAPRGRRTCYEECREKKFRVILDIMQAVAPRTYYTILRHTPDTIVETNARPPLCGLLNPMAFSVIFYIVPDRESYRRDTTPKASWRSRSFFLNVRQQGSIAPLEVADHPVVHSRSC
ncbi:uncharacterized protein F5147DRAFT_761337 [Suillus discolor]|uniref:Uncharacterized protein n=1 Tax=Suillus discolor TaxID=1912936 RepID=A0A9P7JTM9_9AGAM|nr:uncharacterized protein F5147DRAFT_761337 [Suillus discolor]KAG2107170.1 hypothetical protein F5147DRAFT_761337 [Suillus discolor]